MRNDYTRQAASLGDGLGGLSTLLGLSASPLLILSTECISRGGEGEGHEHVNRSIYQGLPREAARVAIDVLMPFHSMTTTDSVESISGGLAKSPSEVLNPPVRRPYT